MGHGGGTPLEELDDEVSVSGSVERVLGDRVKPELLGEEVTVDAERVSSERTASEREDRDSGQEGGEPGEVRVERERVREQQVRPSDRLSAL